jgi:homoserine dehydrogenase
MLTQKVQERKLNDAVREIEALSAISGPVKRIRLETLG